jgi:hypothetical protein
MECQTAEVVLSTIEDIGALAKPLMALVESIFPLRLQLASCDSHKANIKAENAWARAHAGAGWSHMLFRCQMHRAHTCQQRTVALVSQLEAGLVNLTLSLQGAGVMARLRRQMGQVISAKLVIYHGPPPPEANEWRQGVMDLFCSHQAAGQADTDERESTPAARRARRRRLSRAPQFNGDLRRRDEVQHWEQGCCHDRADTLDKMLRIGLPCLASRAPGA